jgi:hypothetical protein
MSEASGIFIVEGQNLQLQHDPGGIYSTFGILSENPVTLEGFTHLESSSRARRAE